MIIHEERMPHTGPFKRDIIRVIRRHEYPSDCIATDSYYEDNGNDTITPLFCIVRNLNGHNPDHLHRRGYCHPLSHTAILTGSVMRNHALFPKGVGDKVKDRFISSLTLIPTETRHMTQVTVPKKDLQWERKHILYNATDIFSHSDAAPIHLLPQSTPFIITDIDGHGASMFYDTALPALSIDIWALAYMAESYETLDEFEEEVTSQASDLDEAILLYQLHELGFYKRYFTERTIPTNPHPDDGLYQYCLQGRYLITQYVNHAYNAFHYHVHDILHAALTFKWKDRQVSPYQNLFEQYQDLALGDEIVW